MQNGELLSSCSIQIVYRISLNVEHSMVKNSSNITKLFIYTLDSYG